MSPPGDQARVVVSVHVPVDAAFEAFTAQIDLWWRRGPKFRQSGAHGGMIHIEPRTGGRVFESIDATPHARVVEIGQVRVWSPPRHLVFSWRNATFAPHENTEVDVRFTASGASTTVELVHRGWSALRPDHPARHGLGDVEFIRMIGLWWGELLASLRVHAARGPRAGNG